jgi:ribosomal protein S18 acetylase RimI-like enzyme
VLRVFPDNAAALALYRSAGFTDVALQPAAIARRDGTVRDVLLMRCACS